MCLFACLIVWLFGGLVGHVFVCVGVFVCLSCCVVSVVALCFL